MADSSLLRVDDLVQSPALQLRVLAGERGLSRRVAWAHVSELEDPTPWLLGSELIMTTGIGVPKTSRRQRAYLERLDNAGVSGVALSAELYVPPLHPAFLEAAEERGMPVLQVPLAVPFIAIAQEVSAAVQAGTHQRLNAQLQVFGTVRWLASADLDDAAVMARLERLSGYTLYVCTPGGRPLLEGVPTPPPELTHLVPTSLDAPPTVPGGYVLPIPAPGGSAGFLLAMEQPNAKPSGLAVVQHIATVAALQLAMHRHQQETMRREGAETLAELLQGTLHGEAAVRRLSRSGFEGAQPLQLMVARGPDGDVNDTMVQRGLTGSGEPCLLLRQQSDLYVLIQATPAALETVGSLTNVMVGVSRPFPAGFHLDVARREALWSLARAADAGGGVVNYDSDPTERWLVDDAAALRGLVGAVLDIASSYDEKHRSDLVPTLRTWMEQRRDTARTAKALAVHPNTVAYRLRRFQELTGRDLSSTSDLAEVWLALVSATHVSHGAEPSEQRPG